MNDAEDKAVPEPNRGDKLVGKLMVLKDGSQHWKESVTHAWSVSEHSPKKKLRLKSINAFAREKPDIFLGVSLGAAHQLWRDDEAFVSS